MKSLKRSYLLLLPSLIGLAGLHRFYMGKIPSGILWICTWGLGGIGTIYDAITMAKQLSEVDEKETGQYNSPAEYWLAMSEDMSSRPLRQRIENRYGPVAKKESLELAALRLARDSDGLITPAQLALEAQVSSDQAKDELDRLVQKGFAEVRIRRNGLVVYAFQEFLSPQKASDLEPF